MCLSISISKPISRICQIWIIQIDLIKTSQQSHLIIRWHVRVEKNCQLLYIFVWVQLPSLNWKHWTSLVLFRGSPPTWRVCFGCSTTRLSGKSATDPTTPRRRADFLVETTIPRKRKLSASSPKRRLSCVSRRRTAPRATPLVSIRRWQRLWGDVHDEAF